MLFRNLFTFLLIATVVVSCKNKTLEPDNMFKFKDYISYNTSGHVSILSSIDVGLVKEVALQFSGM
jgi:hypothetical protein